MGKKTLNGNGRAFENILVEMRDLQEEKNADYGSAFHSLRQRRGQSVILVRLYDKYQRIETLIDTGRCRVKTETLRDSLMDLAAYCVMEIEEMDAEAAAQAGQAEPAEPAEPAELGVQPVQAERVELERQMDAVAKVVNSPAMEAIIDDACREAERSYAEAGVPHIRRQAVTQSDPLRGPISGIARKGASQYWDAVVPGKKLSEDDGESSG